MRHNVALYRSRVDGIPGPDNRLDQQARLTANLGADYRLRSLPLTLGGNVNWVPGYRTQLAADRAVTVNDKRVVDAFALWTFSPAVGLRLLASNLDARDSETVNEIDFRLDLGSVAQQAPHHVANSIQVSVQLYVEPGLLHLQPGRPRRFRIGLGHGGKPSGQPFPCFAVE